MTKCGSQDERQRRNDIFDNFGKISKLWCDLLIVHGQKDEIVSGQHSRELMNEYVSSHSPNCNKALLLEIKEADHDNLLFDVKFQDSEYKKLFIEYFEELIKTASKNREREQEKEVFEEEEEEKEENMKTQNTSQYEGETEECIAENLKREDLDREGWNSSVIVLDIEQSSVRPSFYDRLKKCETEYLRDLYSKLSINKPFDKEMMKEEPKKSKIFQ